jgi:hypothetical protein
MDSGNSEEPDEFDTAQTLLLLSRGFSLSIRPERPETFLNIQDIANIKDGTDSNGGYYVWAALMLADTYCSRQQFYIVEARKFMNLLSMCHIFLNAWANSSGRKGGNLRGRGANGLNTRCLSKEGLYKSRKIASKTVNTIYHQLKDTINVVDCFDQFIDEGYQMSLRETIQNAIDDNTPPDETNLMSFSKVFTEYLQVDMTKLISFEFNNRKGVWEGGYCPSGTV